VRYARDIVAGFQHETDAKAFLAELGERLAKFALSLHPEKARVLAFGRFAAERRAQKGLGLPETFTFLGFNHICSTRRDGAFQLKRFTRRDRMRLRLQSIRKQLHKRKHDPAGLRRDLRLLETRRAPRFEKIAIENGFREARCTILPCASNRAG
jgi:RNA-directed DNA polymerase